MGMLESLVSALRGYSHPDAAKQDMGQGGAAGQMNGNARDAYNRYVEEESVAGRQPMPYPQWYAQRGQPQVQQ